MAEDRSKKRKKKKAKSGEDISGLELVSDDDIIVADDEDIELIDDEPEEEDTGEFEVPEHIIQSRETTKPSGDPDASSESEDLGAPEDMSEREFEEDPDEKTGKSTAPGLEIDENEEDSWLDGDESSPESVGKKTTPWEEEIEGEEIDDEAIEEVIEESKEPSTGEGIDDFEDTGKDLGEAEEEEEFAKRDEGGTDTMDEPLSGRRKSRRRRRLSEQELEEDGANDPWNQEALEGDDQEPPEPDPDGTSQSYPDQTPPDGTKSPWHEDDQESKTHDPDGVTARGDVAFPQNNDPAREKTLIFGESEEGPPEPEYPYLVVVQGEEEGREIELVPDELSIGRGADNDLVFPDIACSRRHALLERQGDTFVVTDLGSGNGTLVNERRIQRAELQDGDEIHIGSTIVQFNMPGSDYDSESRGAPGTVTAAQPIASEGGFAGFMNQLMMDPRKKKYLLFGGGGFLGFLLILVIVKVFSGPSGPPPPTPEEISQQKAAQDAEKFSSYLNTAKRLVNEKKWKEANLNIQLALKLKPSDKMALDYKGHIERETSSSAALQTALDFFDKNDFDNAVIAANQVSSDSEYSVEAQKLKKEIEKKITDDLIQAGKALMEEKQYAQAVFKFDEVLRRDVSNEGAAELKRNAEEQLGIEQRRIASKNRPVVRQPKKQKPKKPEGLTGQVLSFYRNGEIDKAIHKAEDGGSKHLAKLKQFKAAYTRGMDYSRNSGQMEQALKLLSRALALDKEIAGGQGKYNAEIKNKLAKVYFVKGVDRHNSQDYPAAYKSFGKSRDLGFDTAAQRLKELEKIAKKFYEEAYVIKSTNPEQAVSKLNTVLKIIPKNHVYYGKAKRLRAKIQGPLGSSGEGGDSGF